MHALVQSMLGCAPYNLQSVVALLLASADYFCLADFVGLLLVPLLDIFA